MKSEKQIVEIVETLEARIELNESQLKRLQAIGRFGGGIELKEKTTAHLLKLKSQLEGIRLCF
jgi:hypothetical protein